MNEKEDQESKQKRRYEHNYNKQEHDLENSFSSLTTALNDIAERLSRLETRERKGKGVQRS